MKQGNVLRKTVAACSAVLLLSVLLFLLLSHAFKLDHPAFYQIYGAYPFFSDNEEEQELFLSALCKLPRTKSIRGSGDCEFSAARSREPWSSDLVSG